MKYHNLKYILFMTVSLSILMSCNKDDSMGITSNNKDVDRLQKLEGDYQHIIFYGQSLAMGWESPEAITNMSMEGNLMLGNNPNIKYADDPGVFRALIASRWANGGEQPIVAAVNAFSYKYRTEVQKGLKFIGTTAGEGGRSIEQLSKEYQGNENLYNTTFVKALENASNIVKADQSTINCPAIVYMQGEFNYRDRAGLGFNGEDATISKNEYKSLLLKLKNNMQSEVVAKYGQKNKPLFFIYQTSGHYIANLEMTINMAQLEFALENEDVILLNPAYFASDYGGGHLSTNGYRWYGESVAKSLYHKLLKNEEVQPIYPLNYEVNDKQINIKMHVHKLPLVLDTWTTRIVSNYGFAVFKNGVEVRITKVETIDDKVILTFDQSLTGHIEINYSGFSREGTGNLRDSEYYPSYYSYVDLSRSSLLESYTPVKSKSSSEKIYGNNYPLQNWCVPFYYSINK